MPEELNTAQQAPPAADPRGSGTRGRTLAILLVAAGLILLGGLKWFVTSSTRITTDNAFVEARVVPVSARVAGTVLSIPVTDNQLVRKGDLLMEIDQRDYRLQVDKASAGVGLAENETGGEKLRVEGARAALESAAARREQAVLDLARGEKLFGREVIPREQLDRLRTARRVADAQQKEAEESLKRAEAEAGLAVGGGNRARILLRKAQLNEANLQLSYTRVVAPRDGYITRKSVEPGTNIQAGQAVMALVPLDDIWITANYKESQLAHIRPGQKVRFTVDAYPGQVFSGTVESIMAGTGAAFSLLPENATGNYVKVVQRIPVKIAVDQGSDPHHLLRVGMSVVPTIVTGRTARDVFRDINPFR